MLTADDVRISYGDTVALDGVDLSIAAGESVALIGASGSGKSSLLYCLAGLLRPDSGRVSFDGRDLSTLDDEELTGLRRSSFGFVFQFSELVPELTLAENIALPLDLVGSGRRDRNRRVRELISRLGLDDQAGRRPAQVSGGQLQRAAVARAIAGRPAVVFADEPTGALDSANGEIVIDALAELARENGTAIVLVTHDAAVADRADRHVTLHDGRIVTPQPATP